MFSSSLHAQLGLMHLNAINWKERKKRSNLKSKKIASMLSLTYAFLFVLPIDNSFQKKKKKKKIVAIRTILSDKRNAQALENSLHFLNSSAFNTYSFIYINFKTWINLQYLYRQVHTALHKNLFILIGQQKPIFTKLVIYLFIY